MHRFCDLQRRRCEHLDERRPVGQVEPPVEVQDVLRRVDGRGEGPAHEVRAQVALVGELQEGHVEHEAHQESVARGVVERGGVV